MSVIESLRATSAPERRLVAARFFQRMACDSSYFIGILGLATYTLGANATEVSMLMLLLNLCVVVGNLLGGVVVDRIGPRLTCAGALALGVAFAMVVQFLVPSFVLVYALGATVGLISGLEETALRSFPPYLVEGDAALQRTNGLVEFATNVSVVAGPTVGGIISANFDVLRVFVFYAASTAVALAIVLSTHEEFHPVRVAEEGEPGNGHFLADLSEGFRVTFSSTFLRTLFILGFLGFFAFGAFDSLESLFYRDVLRVSADWMGWLTAIMGVGCVVGAVVMMRMSERRLTMGSLVVALFVVGAGSMLYVGTPFVACAMVGQLVTGLGFGVLEPLQTLLVQRDVSLHHLGRVMATMRTGLQSAGIIPLLVAPALADLFGVQAVLFCASAMVSCVALAFGAWLWTRRRRA
ncbi:MAG: MFS transporter [Atopobiaceae bacterium]|jgi:predicted MFS family arabinose efflux permease|nr:MFS transporter [Atopobiaceae bacterium]MCI2172716.1 MFS transporter [Atopobiaceae bacterium]MCI2207023.1 MFS transporter [Atopobiaceae bacterium]